MADIPLNLENDGAALRFAAELEYEPGIGFRLDQKVKKGRGLTVRFIIVPATASAPSTQFEFEPPIVEGVGARGGLGGQLDGEDCAAQ